MKTPPPAEAPALPVSQAVAGGAAASGRRLVMIGHGMVSHRFCVEWTKLAPPGFHLTILAEEPVPAYDRIHLTQGLGIEGEAHLQLAPPSWYAGHGIELALGDAVAHIDRKNQQVTTRQGRIFEYDFLILATGSSARRLPVPGAELPGVYVYRTLADLAAIRQKAATAQTAAVLGGGLLGLEAARALLDLGVQTHVLEAAHGLMSRQLHAEASQMLEHRVKSTGLKVLTGCITTAITQTGNALQLHFRDERSLTVDMIVMAAGVEPRDELARACGLQTGARGGILVNEALESSDPAIFAIGECALPRGVFYGFAAPGFDMARVLAERLAGRNSLFIPSEYPVRLKLAGTDVVTIGDIRGEGSLLVWKSQGMLKQILLDEGRVSGVSLFGSTEDVGRLQTALLQRRRLRSWEQTRFVKTGSPWKPAATEVTQWPATTAVCQCTGVTRGRLSCAFEAGCKTVAALSAETGAGTVCGSCRPLLAQLCGSTVSPAARLARPLLWTCLIAILFTAAHSLLPPIPLSRTVAAFRYDQLWLNGFWKQLTGYVLLGLVLLALLLPLRKRVRALVRVGDYGLWRFLHTALGVLSLLVLVSHTGFRLGFNLNKVLMLNMLTLALTGAFSGAVIALSHRLPPVSARWLQMGWTCVHALLTWPLVVLVLFHILTVYRY
ncbi:nitrite reductase (NADH) large subunit [Prosthecobacter fusiformis]|uniref:Nitrite reductase (NADH) large subunit n=1 Tax=Prosthecobacter fusiformis TaxID=48464 RepID=A0A4R7S765_9BACT|nr:FAD-dependent oxidoreductase [Prosthecobacter fusiformis]TDU73438.1 nitrite reductase (NADH) large subunit [Prosthecobacter fusiformis]